MERPSDLRASRWFGTIELVRADPEIASRLDHRTLTDVFDLEATVVHVDVVFDRLRSLARKEEPVHA